MKHNKFNSISVPLHAADNHFNSEQISALNNFFISNIFGRFAVLATKNTVIDINWSLEQIVYTDFYLRIAELLKWHEFDDVIIVYEDSTRLKSKLEKYAAGIGLTKTINDKVEKINIHYCVMKKSYIFPGLEVADFIIHTAGTSQRDLINRKISILADRKDFKNIFVNIENKYSSFLCIDKVTSKE